MNKTLIKIINGFWKKPSASEKSNSINGSLGVGFADYFLVYARWKLNLESNIKHNVPLISGDLYADINDQRKNVQLPKNEKSILFTKTNGDKYIVTVYIKEDSKFSILKDHENLKHLFWGLDSTNDIEEYSGNFDELERLVLHYWIEKDEYVEEMYVSIAIY